MDVFALGTGLKQQIQMQAFLSSSLVAQEVDRVSLPSRLKGLINVALFLNWENHLVIAVVHLAPCLLEAHMHSRNRKIHDFCYAQFQLSNPQIMSESFLRRLSVYCSFLRIVFIISWALQNYSLMNIYHQGRFPNLLLACPVVGVYDLPALLACWKVQVLHSLPDLMHTSYLAPEPRLSITDYFAHSIRNHMCLFSVE